MNRKVVLARKARSQFHAASDWYAEQAPHIANDWFNGLNKALESLATNPDRFGLARENEDFPYELREMLYGSGRKITHRVLFVIRDEEVIVHQIRHVAQRDITDDDS